MEELPGFRFHPTEEELLEFYLKQVVHGKKLKFDIIPTVQLYRHDPWELPGLARIAGDREWYFFVPRDRLNKQQHAGRPSRTTERGFWKATGSDRAVRCAADPKRLIGLKKTLVYYEGRAPRGTKTDWVMNEYRLPSSSSSQLVLCKIYRKAVSLKELEQRVAMEELEQRVTMENSKLEQRSVSVTMMEDPSRSRCSNDDTGIGSPADSISSSEPQNNHQYPHQVVTMMKTEDLLPPQAQAAAVVRPATLSLPQLEVAIQQDPFLTQLRSPWTMETWSPYYASVLNF